MNVPRVAIPELCLVLLVGASGAGKSTFACRHFLPSEVVSLARCHAELWNGEGDDEAHVPLTEACFDLMHTQVAQRLARGELTVVDAPNVSAAERQPWIALAKQYHVHCTAIVFDLPEPPSSTPTRLSH